MQTTIDRNGSAAQVEENEFSVLFNWDDNWQAPNALGLDDSGHFYLGKSDTMGETFTNQYRVTTEEALAWYAETSKYGQNGSTGSIAYLCEQAAQEIADLRKIIALRNS